MTYKAIEAIPGWYSVAKKAGELYGTIDAYEKVPMLYRAINLRADALGTVPIELTRNGLVVDYPFTTPIDLLIQQTERALLLTGSAYWLKLFKGRVLYGFQFLNPSSVRVSYHEEYQTGINEMSGLRFTQTINGRIYGPWSLDEIVYWREPSIRDDVYGGIAPASVALQSAQLAYYLERFTSAFFEHGAQPAVIMSLDKSITPPEYERLKSDWRSRVENVSNAFKTFFFRGEVKTQILTFPLKDMELVPLQERVTTNITTTFGVPRTMLEASAANYATADSDRQSFWRETIVPRLAFYQRVLNQQVFTPLKYTLAFTPERLDVFQTDEAQRAGSLLQLVQAGIPLANAMSILGYEAIDTAIGLPAPVALPDVTGVNVSSNTEVIDPTLADEIAIDVKAVQAARLADLDAYERKATKRHKAKGTAVVSFESDSVPRYMLDFVNAELKSVKKKSDIAHVFHFVKALTLADLTAQERKVYDAIARKLETHTASNARAIASGDYTSIDTDLRNVLTDSVAQLVLDAGAQRIRTMANTGTVVGDDIVRQGIANHANTYIDSYWNPFLEDLSNTERDYIASVITNAQTTVGITAGDIQNQLAMFGDLRAQRIAFTEPTRAAAQQTFAIQKQALASGINTTMVWIAENDSEVCDECEPLDTLTQNQWGPEYADGPPAHVNCRCAIGLVLVQSAIATPEAGNIEVVADPNATPPPVPLLQRSAKDIADHIKQAVPATLAQDALEVDNYYFNLQGTRYQLHRARIDASTQYGFNSPEYIAADAKYKSEEIRIKALRVVVNAQEEAIYRQVLRDLQHPTPQQVQVNFVGVKMNASQQQRVTELIQLAIGIAPDSGAPIVINYNASNRNDVQGGSFGVTYIRGKRFDNVMNANPDSVASTIVHESMHGLQDTQQFGIRATDDFGNARTQNEKRVSLSAQGYNATGYTYLDATDSAYTFRIYDKRIQATSGKWAEVLTTAIDSIALKPTNTDTGLLELFAQILKDGGK